MTNEEKLQILNSIKITDIVSFDGYAEMVMIENNRENRSKLHQLGLTDEEIQSRCFVAEGTLDISDVGFDIADSFDLEEWKFYNKGELRYGNII